MKIHMSETNLVRACLRMLATHGIFAWRVNSGAMAGEYKGRKRFVRFNSAPGCSDIIGVAPSGRFLAIECKVGSNKLTGPQDDFLRAVNDAGGIGFVVRNDTTGLIETINELDQCRSQ